MVLFCLFYLVVGVAGYAQTNNFTLTGKLVLHTNEVFPYKLVLKETNGVVSGYSITYDDPNDTKTTVTGTLDRRTKKLTFKESGIVYSHMVHTTAYMCLLSAELGYGFKNGERVLTGDITSTEVDNTACTGGVLVFSKKEEIQHLFDYHDDFDTVISMKKKQVAPVAETEPEVIPTKKAIVEEQITEGIEKTFDWYSDSVVISVWDGGNIDGDRITLLYNKVPLLTNYYLVKEKKELHMHLTRNAEDTVTIIALNEGSDPPNTANLLFTDGQKQYSVLAYNTKGRRAVIKLRRVKR